MADEAPPQPKLPPKPWTLAQFKKFRPDLFDFVFENIMLLLVVGNIINIRAPVKCGKREMMEIIALFNASKSFVNILLTALNRVADKPQHAELTQHNLDVRVISSQKSVGEFAALLEKLRGTNVIFHIDESDFGSDEKQLLSQCWELIRGHPNSICILYSATPEEIIFADPKIITKYFKPPPGFCGPLQFLEANLLHQAEPSFHINEEGKGVLSPQSKEILKGALACPDPNRRIFMLRLTGNYTSASAEKKQKQKKEQMNFHKFKECYQKGHFDELKNHLVFFDEKTRIQWSEREYFQGLIDRASGKSTRVESKVLVILVNQQTATRSTELACHNFLFAYHDYRDEKAINFSTMSQAQERCNHYRQTYGGIMQPIQQYGHLPTYTRSAKLQQSHGEHAMDPDYKQALSTRVKTTLKSENKGHHIWFKTNKENWDKDYSAAKQTYPELQDKKNKNPFLNSKQASDGRWLAYHRDPDWNVFVYDNDDDVLYTDCNGERKKVTDPFAKVDSSTIRCKICYCKEECGVLITFFDETVQNISHQAVGSMYASDDEPPAKRR